ncbi:ABC-2 type transporter [Catenulispora acidiphila DSM 44928]|uniref:Transport permease protein n=1 Tax=Catenulispora acidiphila (strain DSM 44928 / JCM 14897 / NBRC 102108 / NRRL B-24433 / ID139908) TaxID=479433 RepID=C7Q8I3_CATAD|nr:ABC transporter permease [Catenulispora acidiphila]ACU76171.1 ABC-2 type transporter [Catenulispora acidiphila DSM 44928]
MSAMTTGQAVAEQAAGRTAGQSVETAKAAEGTTEAMGRQRATLSEIWRIGRIRMVIEVVQLRRNTGLLIYTFAVPVVMLLLFGSIFRGDIEGTSATYQQVYVTGMTGMCVINGALQNLAYQVAAERHTKALKRLRTTPMPAASYFLGKVASVLAATVAQVAVMLLVGVTVMGLKLPTSVGPWLTFTWVLLLGCTACSLLGIGMSGLIRSENGSAIVWLPVMVLQFISGVFIVFSQLPKPVQQVGAVFPIKWLCQGMRSVFLPDSFKYSEPAQSWEHGRLALVLAAWCVVGLMLCLKTFTWRGRDDG